MAMTLPPLLRRCTLAEKVLNFILFDTDIESGFLSEMFFFSMLSLFSIALICFKLAWPSLSSVARKVYQLPQHCLGHYDFCVLECKQDSSHLRTIVLLAYH